jgi:SAM-dependent methyltransferase
MNNKKILDACCGGRMMWFDKHHPDAVYVDNRRVNKELIYSKDGVRYLNVEPDIMMDFIRLDFPDETFYHVVFDPPHLMHGGKNSYIIKKYGILPGTWQEYIHSGFAECWRVLKPNGTLVFKWNECQIPTNEVIRAIDHLPLYGHKSGKASRTHWLCFMKIKGAQA